jgi:hypothetical protein
MEVIAQLGIGVKLGKNTVSYTKMNVITLFFQEMKFNIMLHDYWIEYFMAWTQVCIVVYIFNEMHKTFLQL